ncbi:hypothetical protein V502_10367 [Pseudogymnoascus sp. VKM F-4520 (FW-2644)]|nr:hypothetical protein V502_10367 [Pseudogymnoascus sp. VKM F-4520 (FW-2644)]
MLGFGTRQALLINGLSGALSIVECTMALYFLERLGRIKLMVFSAAGMGLALVVNAVLSQYFVNTDGAQNPNSTALRAMVAMNFVFNPFFFTFTGVISWVYPAEIFPVEIRARGNSITTLTNWTMGLIIGQVSPIALQAVGFRYFYASFVFNMVAAICYAVFYPETKGKTLEQMDTLFGDQVVPHALQDPVGAAAAMDGFEKHPDSQIENL